MATTKKSPAKKAPAKKSAAKKSPARKSAPAKKSTRAQADATTLLAKDHKDVKALFKRYERLSKAEADVDEDLLDEAEVEHASAKDLIGQIQSMQPDDDLYDAKVTVLGEYINHHVEEEEGQMFPKARRAKVDLAGLAEQLKQRKQELMSQSGAPAKSGMTTP